MHILNFVKQLKFDFIINKFVIISRSNLKLIFDFFMM